MSKAASSRRVWQYAQEKKGQRLHLAPMRPDRSAEEKAACGRIGPWRRTIDVPVAIECRACARIVMEERDE